ncbi:MAG: ABC-F family ATP-binding cassette domain-containing protein [Bdellovibrionota bacterium]
MLLVSSVSKSYGSQELLTDVSFTVNYGERVGLVGRNGHGKTTLLRMILKQEEPDSGNISVPKDYTVGHLSQHLVFNAPTVLDEACLALPMLEGDWQETYKAEAMLNGLGFSEADFAKSPMELSGGYQIRLNLTKLLLSEPNLLLLDEPTNYLDIVSIRWLQRFLTSWQGELMLITHDREFMDAVCTHIVGIHRGKARKIEGHTEKLYSLLAEEEELYEKTRLNEAKRRQQAERFIERFRAQASRAKAVQSRVKQLEKLEVMDKLAEIDSLEFRFRSAPFPGKWLMDVKDLSFGYDGGPALISDLSFAVGKRDRIAIIGPNGRGKTTLLNLLANEMPPTTGSVTPNNNTVMGYFGQTNINRLHLKSTVEEEIGQVDPDKHRTIIRSICGAMMFEGDAALKRISVLSGGERSRVLLGKLLMTPANLLLLDEPTNHLDMYSIDSLLAAIDEFEGAVVIVTHSEMILHRMATRLIVFDRGEVIPFEGSYQDFLERVGWSNEDDDPAASGRKQPKTKKEQRQKRAENSKVLSPLRKRVTEIEESIVSEEAAAKDLNEKLVTASASAPQDVAGLSKQLHESAKRITSLFEDLERATKELELKEAEVDAEA